MNSNNDSIRNNCVIKINTVVNNHDLSRNIEKSIFNTTINNATENNINRRWDNKIFYNLYFSKIRSIFTNLDKGSHIKNTYLLDKIKSGDIKAEDISKLSVYEIHPENWKSLIDAKIKRDKINDKIEELQDLKASLEWLIKKCPGNDKPNCPILEELAG